MARKVSGNEYWVLVFDELIYEWRHYSGPYDVRLNCERAVKSFSKAFPDLRFNLLKYQD